VATYDAGKPGVYVTYADNKSSSVETWVNQSSQRVIQSHDADANRMLISMPLDDLGVGLLDRLRYDTIAEKAYVERVAFVHDLGTPVVDELVNESDAVAPTGAGPSAPASGPPAALRTRAMLRRARSATRGRRWTPTTSPRTARA